MVSYCKCNLEKAARTNAAAAGGGPARRLRKSVVNQSGRKEVELLPARGENPRHALAGNFRYGCFVHVSNAEGNLPPPR